MNTFEKLCEMNAGDLVMAILGAGQQEQMIPNQEQPTQTNQEKPTQVPQNATAIKSVQPTDGVDNAGMIASKKIQISESPEGDIRVDTEDITIQLSNTVASALKIYFERTKQS